MKTTAKTLFISLFIYVNAIYAGNSEITFSENLRFGGGEDPVFIWPDSRVSLSIDSKSFIYISDVSESRVLKFEPDGTLVDVIIQKGQGPQEIEALTHFQVLNDGSARAYQYKGRTGLLKMYDQKLQHQKNLSNADFGVTPLTIQWAPTGDWAVIEYNERDPEARAIVTHVGLLNKEMKLEKSFSSTHMPVPSRDKMTDRDFWVSFFAAISQLHFQPRTLLAFDQQNRIYQAESGTYAVTRWNPGFDQQEKVFKKSVEKRPWTPKDLDKLANDISQQYTEAYPPQLKQFLTPEIVREGLDQADISHGRNPLAGLIVTDDNKLLVVLNQDRPDDSQVADVFNPDGSYLGRLKVPRQGLINSSNQTRMVFQGDQAYTIETVDEGVHQVVRYTVNWETEKAAP